MLKKLVKYGNSNALVLDKAILELLGIEEGATIKIRTDGKSIIITPHAAVPLEKVHEPFTHDQASLEAMANKAVKRYKGLSMDEQGRLEQEFVDLIKRRRELAMKLAENQSFRDEATRLAKQMQPDSPAYLAAFKALQIRFSPELGQLEKELLDFETKNKLTLKGAHEPIKPLDEKKYAAMEQEFMAAHQKHFSILHKVTELLHNPEYHHQAQLIAEKYDADKNSAAYLEAINALTDSYFPQLRKAQEEIASIATQYDSKE